MVTNATVMFFSPIPQLDGDHRGFVESAARLFARVNGVAVDESVVSRRHR